MTETGAPIGLDPDWIASVLESEGRRPASVEFAGFVGTGQMSRNARFVLTWPDDEGPDSVMVKIPSADDGTRSIAFDRGLYRRECDFYRLVTDHVDVSVPGLYAVHFDQPGLDFALVLEDLVDSVAGDQFVDATDDELALAVRQAAALHAPVWDRTAELGFDAFDQDPHERAEGTEVLVNAFLPVVFERLGPNLEPEVVDLLERFGPQAGAWVLRRSSRTTLVHGDFRPDNFLFARTDQAPPIAVVDWQTLTLGPGATDVAYLLGAAVAPERRRQVEPEMMELYRSELARRGVDYSAEVCRDEYVLSACHGVVVAIMATAVADVTERGDALFTLMLNRHGRHALDLGSLGAIGT